MSSAHIFQHSFIPCVSLLLFVWSEWWFLHYIHLLEILISIKPLKSVYINLPPSHLFFLTFSLHFYSMKSQAEENRYFRLITFERLLEEPDIREVIIKQYTVRWLLTKRRFGSRRCKVLNNQTDSHNLTILYFVLLLVLTEKRPLSVTHNQQESWKWEAVHFFSILFS